MKSASLLKYTDYLLQYLEDHQGYPGDKRLLAKHALIMFNQTMMQSDEFSNPSLYTKENLAKYLGDPLTFLKDYLPGISNKNSFQALQENLAKK